MLSSALRRELGWAGLSENKSKCNTLGRSRDNMSFPNYSVIFQCIKLSLDCVRFLHCTTMESWDVIVIESADTFIVPLIYTRC